MFSPVGNFYEHNQNETVLLEHLNDELWVLHIPAVIFVLICVILGFVGNSLVVYIYGRTKFRRSNHRYFILCLAFLDLIGCLIGGSHMTYSLRMPYLMTSTAICKISRYFHHLVNQGSAFLLVVIATERFNKLCRPFKRQFNHRQTLLQCVLSVGFSAIVSCPAAILYGNSTIMTGVKNITGTTCFITDEFRDTIFTTIYMIYLLVETVVITIVIGVLYTFIIHKIWSYRNLAISDAMLGEHALKNAELNVAKICSHAFEDRNDNDQNLAHSNMIDKDNNKTCTKIKDGDVNEKDVIRTSQDGDVLAGKCREIMPHATNIRTITCLGTDSLNRVRNDGKIDDKEIGKEGAKTLSNSSATKHGRTFYEPVFCNSSKKRRSENDSARISREKRRKRSMEAIHVTIMLFLITLVFCISFYPHLVLILLAINDGTFLWKFTASEVVVFQLFLRIFIINNTANPIIYIFCDAKFRAECKRLFRRIFSC